jgi:hypothetical protein
LSQRDKPHLNPTPVVVRALRGWLEVVELVALRPVRRVQRRNGLASVARLAQLGRDQ